MSLRKQRYIPLAKQEQEEFIQSSWKMIWIQTKFDLQKAWSGKWAKFPFFLAGFFWFFTTIAILTELQAQTILPIDYWGRLTRMVKFYLNPRRGPGGTLVTLGVTVMASGLIADDLGKRAIVLYGPKMKKRDYLISKLLTAGIIVFISLPMWVLLFLFTIFYKTEPPLSEIIDHFDLISNVLLMWIIYMLLFGSVVLTASSITDRGLIAGVLTIVYILASEVISYVILYKLTKVSVFAVISPTGIAKVFFKVLFNEEQDVPNIEYWAILSTLLYLVIAYFFVQRSVKKGGQD